jgi:hypothetical protein
MAKSYKQLYEEAKITDEEIFALKAVAYGCNTNRRLQPAYGAAFLDGDTKQTVKFEDALITVYKLIERLSSSKRYTATVSTGASDMRWRTRYQFRRNTISIGG